MAESNKISFYAKDSTRCPVCEEIFKREELFSGRGRLISKDINSELRRTYDVNPKYGKIHPLAYTLNVCPNCWYAASPAEFTAIQEETARLIKDLTEYRKKLVQELFSPFVIDFYVDREIKTGCASYILALSCYSFFPSSFSPTIKRGIYSLRAAWLFGDMAEEFKTYKDRFYKAQELMYIKSKDYYNAALDLMTKNKERIDNVNLGPDMDKNYGYDGFIYLMNYLNFKTAYREADIMKKLEIYRGIKRNIGKIFGLGKTSKEKPGPLLNIVRTLYDEVNNYIKEIEQSLGIASEE